MSDIRKVSKEKRIHVYKDNDSIVEDLDKENASEMGFQKKKEPPERLHMEPNGFASLASFDRGPNSNQLEDSWTFKTSFLN